MFPRISRECISNPRSNKRNRPLTVAFAGKTTAYVYGADGARLKKLESDPVAGTSVTLYLGAAEIRKYGQG